MSYPYRFIVPFQPVGYYASGKVPNWKRMKAYHAYKELVQLHASAAGLLLPLMATKDDPLFISTCAYFRNGIHCDPGNVQKGIVDALFWTPRGKKSKGSGDKYTGGMFEVPKYDRLYPRVVVHVSRTGKGWAEK